MNTLDVVVLVIVLGSTGFAFARGFIREILSIAAWLGAALITLYGYSYAVPFAERFLPKGLFANAAAGIGVFVVALIVLSILTAVIARRAAHSGLSGFDRILGLVFGLVRGAIIVALGYIALAWYLPADKPRPDWVTQARTLPLLQAGANMIEHMLPGAWRDKVETTAIQTLDKADRANDVNNAVRALTAPKPTNKPAPEATPGYNVHDRNDMNRLIQEQGQH